MVRVLGVVGVALALWPVAPAKTGRPRPEATPAIARFIEATSPDEKTARAALDEIAAGWKDGYAAMFIDMVRLMRGPRQGASDLAEPAPRVRATVEANPENRAIQIVAESPEFYRSSEIPLDGEHAPRTTIVEFRSLPGGSYTVTAVLIRVNGRSTASQQLNVVGRGMAE